MDIKNAKQEVLKAGNELVELGLVARTWGNVSCRIDENTFAITPSGIAYDRLDENSIVVVDMNTMEYEGSIKPSSEKGIHAAAYKLDPDVNFVIHTHQTYATCISISGFAKLDPSSDELKILGGRIGLGAYGISSTKKLTKIVADEIALGRHAILMANHGAALLGKDREEAFKRATTLEDVCMRAMSDLPKFNDAPAQDTDDIEKIRKSISSGYSDFKSIMVLSSEAVKKAMDKTDTLPAILDDFAQMVGSEMKTAGASDLNDIKSKLKGKNAVYVKGIGAICCAASDYDCSALLTLVEKNALAFLNAEKNGDSPSLSFFDKKLMRFVYLKKYSKKNTVDAKN